MRYPIGWLYGFAGDLAMMMAGGIGWEHIAILGWRLAVALLWGDYGLGSIKEIPPWLKASMGGKKKRYRGHGAW